MLKKLQPRPSTNKSGKIISVSKEVTVLAAGGGVEVWASLSDQSLDAARAGAGRMKFKAMDTSNGRLLAGKSLYHLLYNYYYCYIVKIPRRDC